MQEGTCKNQKFACHGNTDVLLLENIIFFGLERFRLISYVWIMFFIVHICSKAR